MRVANCMNSSRRCRARAVRAAFRRQGKCDGGSQFRLRASELLKKAGDPFRVIVEYPQGEHFLDRSITEPLRLVPWMSAVPLMVSCMYMIARIADR